MLLLCSNGLTSDALISCVSQFNGKNAALVVTADPEYKEKNYHVAKNIEELQKCGYSVDIVDIDIQPINCLLKYDVVAFIGGNPYYLLKSLKECNAHDILKQIADTKCLIGWSAGAIVMGPTIALIDIYTPEMNLWNLSDLTGMNLTDVQILPHYSRFKNRYERYEERCCEYEKINNCQVIRLNDGQGVLIDSDIKII